MYALLEKVTALAEKEGISIIEHELPHVVAAALKDEKILAIDVEKISGIEMRVKITYHEVGHFCTESFYTVDVPLQTWGKCEAKADSWAIRQLCPVDKLKRIIKEGYRNIWEIAEEMGLPIDLIKKAIDYYTRKQLLY